jgi:KaiC/GvpD/RAD55 family RecA-like ATPase
MRNNEVIIMPFKRIPTGVTGLDSLLQGGFPDGFCVLISGSPGAGKTILALQFLMESAKKGEAGIYVTLDQRIKDLQSQAKQFGWNFQEYEKGGFIRFMKPSKGGEWDRNILEKVKSSELHHEILPAIKASVDEINAKRLIIDSLSTLTVSLPKGFGDGDVRLFLNFSAMA